MDNVTATRSASTRALPFTATAVAFMAAAASGAWTGETLQNRHIEVEQIETGGMIRSLRLSLRLR